jgi:hypothetical protein
MLQQLSESPRLPPYRQRGYEQGSISVIAQVAGSNMSATDTEVGVTSLIRTEWKDYRSTCGRSRFSRWSKGRNLKGVPDWALGLATIHHKSPRGLSPPGFYRCWRDEFGVVLAKCFCGWWPDRSSTVLAVGPNFSYWRRILAPGFFNPQDPIHYTRVAPYPGLKQP